jgi:dolichol-phosphate mannosyltransferase
MDLTILIPVKNEENNIDSIVEKIKYNIKINYEIVFINDFCTDNTCLKIKILQKKNSNILLINNKKKGLGESVRNGIKNSNGKYISILMCDGSDDLKDLHVYYQEIKNNNLDAVFGSRFIKNSIITDYPKMKYILNRIFNLFVSLVYLNSYNDYTNAFKIYKRNVLTELEPIVSESFNVFLELPLKIINRKMKYKIIPINWYGRKHGVTKFKLNELKSKYVFTLIYCFAEKILLLKKDDR